jgi:hypothetical protein
MVEMVCSFFSPDVELTSCPDVGSADTTCLNAIPRSVSLDNGLVQRYARLCVSQQHVYMEEPLRLVCGGFSMCNILLA